MKRDTSEVNVRRHERRPKVNCCRGPTAGSLVLVGPVSTFPSTRGTFLRQLQRKKEEKKEQSINPHLICDVTLPIWRNKVFGFGRENYVKFFRGFGHSCVFPCFSIWEISREIYISEIYISRAFSRSCLSSPDWWFSTRRRFVRELSLFLFRRYVHSFIIVFLSRFFYLCFSFFFCSLANGFALARTAQVLS